MQYSSRIIVPTSYGIGASVSGLGPVAGTDTKVVTSGATAGTGDFTLLVLANPPSEASGKTLAAQHINTGNLQAGLYANLVSSGSNSAGNFALYTYNTAVSGASGPGVDGNYHVFAARRAAAAHTVWRDGANVTSATTNDGTARNFYNASQRMGVGSRWNGSNWEVQANSSTAFLLFGAWNRALSDAELAELGRNPWALFEGPTRRVWVPSPGGPTPITGTSAVAFSVSGALTGAGALAGTSAATFSATGALTGTGALVGASSAAFATSGALTGLGRLLGTSAPAFTVTSALTGTGALLGSASATFAASAVLTGTGALTGTVATTFAATGALTAASSGAITGAVAFSFTPVGALTGKGALSSAVTLTTSATAALTGLGALTGTIPLTASVTGALQAAPSGAVTGAASASFSISGTLTGAGALQGASALAFSLAASLSGLSPIAGVASVTISVNGTLSNGASAELVGAVGLTLNIAGTLTPSPDMLGAVSLAFSVSGQFGSMGDGAPPQRTIGVSGDRRTIYARRDGGRVIRVHN